ncbi:MAG: hypothetical protein AB1498_04460 [bacterium]
MFKTILSGFLMLIFIFGKPGLASDDVLEEIGADLERPKAVEKQKAEPYFSRSDQFLKNLFKAMARRDSYIIYKELYLSERYSSELEQMEGRNSLGFILFGTFSGQRGQIGDMNVQFRAAYYNNQFAYGSKMGREYTEGRNDFETELHNAYLRLRVLPPMVNVRLGHFYVPFGIQPWIDTHGTLLQSPAMEFSGVDRDWGVGLEGQNELFEYQAAVTRGSGMEYFERDGNYILSGKISTPRIGEHLNEWLGMSCLIGKVFDPMAVEKLRSVTMDEKESSFMGNVIKKWRMGLDGQKLYGPLRLRGEISVGRDADKENVLAEFAEIKYSLDRDNRWSGFAQFENFTQNRGSPENGSNTALRGGLTYGFSANYNLQFVVSRDLDTIFGEKDTWVGLLFYGQKG